MQENVSISDDNVITGSLKKLTTGAIAEHWGAGNFLALKFSDFDERAESVYVGLEPSAGSGLVDILPDPDKNGVFKITDKSAQRFKIVSINGDQSHTQYFDLSNLTVAE